MRCLSLALLIWALGCPAALAQSFEKQAAELARLRAEVEKLEGQLASERVFAASELKALGAQKGELALLVQKEKIRVIVLRKERARQLARLRTASARSASLVPDLLASVSAVEAVVKTSLPFKRAARLSELAKIRRGLLRRTLTPQTAASRLWQHVEDELKLCHESGLHQQTITLGGHRVLAEVARIGMVALLFRAGDGRTGYARRGKDGSFTHVTVSEGPVKVGIGEVFEALKKQIRAGMFRVPLPPLAGGAR